MQSLTLANVSELLTEDVIDNVYKIKTNSDDNVRSVKVSRAAPAGEGLISAVYRIKVTGDNYRASFIAKSLVQDPLLRKSLNSHILFKRDVKFITDVLPVLIEVQKTLGAKECIQNSVPKFYTRYCDGVNDYILMEDLSEKECTSVSTQPTKFERNSILDVLAHFHSVSFALRVKKPHVFEEINIEMNELYFNDNNRDWYAKYLQRAIDIDKKVVAEFEGANGIYNKKFEELVRHDVYGQLIKLASTRGDHPVVNHGDAWCSNFLCSKDKAIAIDFQLLRCTSPALDLSYFLILCSNQYTNKEDFYEAVNIYYNSLEYYLKDMGLDPKVVFPYHTLNEELKKYGKFGMLASLTSIPLMSSERCDVLQSFEEKYSNREKIPLEE